MHIAQTQWVILRSLERLGWLGGAAVLMLLAVLPAYFLVVSPVKMALAEATQLASMPHTTAQKPMTATDNLHAFLQALPPVSNRATSIKAVMDLAASKNMLLDEVTYKADNMLNDAISHTQIEFTVVASYSEIQNFLSTLLHQLNYVSIDALILSREVVQDEVIEARIRLALHFNALEVSNNAP